MTRYAFIAVIVLGIVGWSYTANAALLAFVSEQVGSSPTNGYVLQTNGTTSTWVATSTLGITGSGGTFSFTVTGYGVSTSTTVGFLNGILSTASSTFTVAPTFSTITSALLKTSSTGVLQAAANGTDYTLITATTCGGSDKVSAITAAGVVTCSADQTGAGGSFPFTTDSYSGVTVNATSTALWLKSTSPFSLIASTTFATNASSSQLTVSGSAWLPSLTSALVVTDTAGLLAEYAGTSCTNQFVRSLSALGAATCATVGTADVAGLDISDDTNLAATWPITLTGDTLAWDGLATSTTPTIGNLAYWTGAKTLGTVATTSATCSGGITCSGFNVLGSSPITLSSFSWPFTIQPWGVSTSTVVGFTNGMMTLASSTFPGGIWTTDGKVGIGTTTPRALLHVGHYGASVSDISFYASSTDGFTNAINVDVMSRVDGTGKYAYQSINYRLVNPDAATKIKDLWSFGGEGTYLDNGTLNNADFYIYDALGLYYKLMIQNDGAGTNNDGGVFIGGRMQSSTDITNSAMTLLSSRFVGIATTTPQWPLTSFSTTSPQLSLSTGAGVSQWTMRNAGGRLYFATTTTVGTATSTVPAITINTNGHVGIATSTPGSVFSINAVANFVSGAVSTIYNGLRVLGNLIIPTGAAPTMGNAGDIALDTTSNNLIVASSTSGHFVVGSATTTLYAYTATTSPIISGTNLELPPHPLAQVATKIGCQVTSGTSLVVNLSDGTNDTNTATCTTTWTEYALTSNYTFTASERIRVEYGTKTGDTGDIVMRIMGYRTSN